MEIVNLNEPYLTWRNFPKLEITFGKLNDTLIFTIFIILTISLFQHLTAQP
jgi:hypothetical protein